MWQSSRVLTEGGRRARRIQIDIAPVRTDRAPDEGMTSGSNSVEQSGNAVRRAAATLRGHLIGLVADMYGGAVEDWRIVDGALHLPGTNHRESVIGMISDIALDVVVDASAPAHVKQAGAQSKLVPRGLTEMVTGQFTFVHDLDAPGLLHARVIRPPHANARLVEISQKAERIAAKAGLKLFVDGSFIAVTGHGEWAVVKAALSLAKQCVWDHGSGLPEVDVFTLLNPETAQRFAVINGTPTDLPIPPPIDTPDHSARYERPYQMHGALAPSAALAHWTAGRLEIQSHSQGIYPLRESIADSLGLANAQVTITHVPGSGCYGHNGADDAAYEAALIARAIPGSPILLKWTREDEHAWEPYAPPMAVDLTATLNETRIAAYSAEVCSDTHRSRPRPGANRAGPSKLLANRFLAEPINPKPATPNMGNHAGMHRNLEPIYDSAETRLVKNLIPDIAHRTSAMRCLGGAANVFALESFMDELAPRANLDPIEFRRRHLTNARDRAVLDELDRQVRANPKSAGRGVAYAQYKNQMARVGLCVDIDINDRAEISLVKATIVADAGRVIDADGLSAQLEGGFIQAASWALYEQVQWDRDGITSRDWDSYPVIRFDNIPEINVTILDQPTETSLGAGEASPGPTIAAIGNAIHDATGLRLRRMPFVPDEILQIAISE
jgi:nicotinate dehydrogenase subunit B